MAPQVFAQQPLNLITRPTAGSLTGGELLLGTQLYDGGGVMQTVTVGVTGLVDLGVSYGGGYIVGSRPVVWQPHVGGHLRVRIIEETLSSPAVALGFDSQGDGRFIHGAGANRFRTKSPGAYIVASRNYRLLGDLGIHAGANYSLEDDDGDRDPSFWAGVDKSVGSFLNLVAEYDFATNDNENDDISAEGGFLNAGIIWRFGNGFAIEFDLKNILRNARLDSMGQIEDQPQPSRELRFFYSTSL